MDWDQINAMGQIAGMRQREQQQREAAALRRLLEEQERQRKGVCPCPHCGGGVPQEGVKVCMHCRRELHWQAGHCGATIAEARRLADKAAASRAASGDVAIIRTSAMTGNGYNVQVFVDGQLAANIGNGKSVRLSLPAGRRVIEARGGGLSRKVTVDVLGGKTVSFRMYFSNWGILGGGLVLKPA
jgi:hypothetical protein